MDQGTYFRDHWVTIEPERFAYYDTLFRLPDGALDALLAPLALTAGHVALDLGCGPGYVATRMAHHVGAAGHVHGVDVNAEFVERARSVAAAAGAGDRCTFHLVDGDTLPLPDGSVDRAVAKNVFEYVPDVEASLTEVHRCLRPGGRLVALDSDWGFLVVEPLTAAEIVELMTAASPAFREPYIGRALRGAFRRAGFTEVEVAVNAMTDTAGRARGVIENMINYGLTFGRLGPDRAAEFRARLDAAQADGSYLVVLPQFVVTGTRV